MDLLEFDSLSFSAPLLELKFARDGQQGELEGYAATFGSTDLGGDTIAPGAFTETLAKHQARGSRPAMLWSHRRDSPVGVGRRSWKISAGSGFADG
jgi:phage head maturation protease